MSSQVDDISETIVFRMRGEDAEQLKDYAKGKGKSVAQICRQGVKAYVRNNPAPERGGGTTGPCTPGSRT